MNGKCGPVFSRRLRFTTRRISPYPVAVVRLSCSNLWKQTSTRSLLIKVLMTQLHNLHMCTFDRAFRLSGEIYMYAPPARLRHSNGFIFTPMSITSHTRQLHKAGSNTTILNGSPNVCIGIL